jgi:hypothetical protein
MTLVPLLVGKEGIVSWDRRLGGPWSLFDALERTECHEWYGSCSRTVLTKVGAGVS